VLVLGPDRDCTRVLATPEEYRADAVREHACGVSGGRRVAAERPAPGRYRAWGSGQVWLGCGHDA